MYSKEITVTNQVGLYARPATFFIQKANEFRSTMMVEKAERKVNAKSLLGVLSLGITKGSCPYVKHTSQHKSHPSGWLFAMSIRSPSDTPRPVR